MWRRRLRSASPATPQPHLKPCKVRRHNMNAQPFNFNFAEDKPTTLEPIPDGTIVYVQMTYTPGGSGPDNAFTKTKPSADNPTPDTEYLKAEFTVLRGPYRGRLFWANLTLKVVKRDETGNSKAVALSRGHTRLMLDSARGLSSKDESPEANARRNIKGFPEMQGIKFVCRVKVEPAKQGYPAKNGLGQVLTKDMKDYPQSEADLDNPKVVAITPRAEAALPEWAAPAPAAPAAQPIIVATPVFAQQPTETAAQPSPPAAPATGDRPLWMQ